MGASSGKVGATGSRKIREGQLGQLAILHKPYITSEHYKHLNFKAIFVTGREGL
jgi:hypothetical protein